MKKAILLFAISICPMLTQAQYTGGSGKGDAMVASSAQSFGDVITFGGQGDGNVSTSIQHVILGDDVFRGGQSDGNATTNSAKQVLGESIAFGGISDGNAQISALNRALGESISFGGISDGNSSYITTAQSFGENVFRGGISDGNTSLNRSTQSLGERVYSGGAGDGWMTSTSNQQQIGESIFYGGSSDGWATATGISQPLPVFLLSFGAIWENNDALLQWKSAQEMNLAGYLVSRSFNGLTFDSIGYTTAQGFSSEVLNYTYTDVSAKTISEQSNWLYYQLTPIDLDGTKKKAVIAVLPLEKIADSWILAPCPANEFTVLWNTEPGNQVTVTLFNALGQKVLNLNQQTPVFLPTEELPSGHYFLHINQGAKCLYQTPLTIIH